MTGRPRIRTPEEVLSLVRHLSRVLEHPPTVRELAWVLGVSPATASRYLRDLESRGWITRWPGARGIRIEEKPKVGR